MVEVRRDRVEDAKAPLVTDRLRPQPQQGAGEERADDATRAAVGEAQVRLHAPIHARGGKPRFGADHLGLRAGQGAHDVTEDPARERGRVAAVGEQDGNDTEIQILIETVAISYTVGRWTDAEAANLDEPDPPNYLCSNHLLVATEEEAQAALERFEAGEAFADLAIELSTGPSGPSGGDLGCAVEGQFVPEFEEAAYAGAAGDVVGPVETTFGWHLIEIESVGPATVDNHPDADPAVLAQIALDMQRGMVNLMILDLEGTAAANFRDQATVDPVIGTLADDSLEVIPPG